MNKQREPLWLDLLALTLALAIWWRQRRSTRAVNSGHSTGSKPRLIIYDEVHVWLSDKYLDYRREPNWIMWKERQ